MQGNKISIHVVSGLTSFMLFLLVLDVQSQEIAPKTELDKKVEAFLESYEGKWRDMNIPSSDGKLLYDIILKNGYTKGLEIGTSTGHSAIWIAWAFSKTGGKLITIDIDETRHKQALANLKEVGLSEYVDARLADAHKLVKELDVTFDFVFSDADKGWYINYFKDIAPKLKRGGCFTAHNVRPKSSGQRGMRGTGEYLEYVLGLDTFTTTVDNSGGGLAISYKN
ncbi:O-methyltransferase [Ulvibacterium marinum]|uniref:O-methyltransferase n=1 Tax=Ulvibacterium marinum TaxID=2419782 RepID=UPI002494F34C|nr:class I SAM-dependent methyltransferase [Ulvibacterium marinum]